jgi:hypothetical protein
LGTGGTITVVDGSETHPAALVTVNVYNPDGTPVTFTEAPVADIFTPAGLLMSVHWPCDGKPVIVTLPVGFAHVGAVTFPGTGDPGSGGCEFITTFLEGDDVQPMALATVKLYVPGASPCTV